MKGDERVVKKLDELLCDELTAIMQYVVHAEMCASWGYQRLHQAVETRARQEMHHSEKLIARILFLEGTPTVSRLNQVHIGADVPQQLQADLESERQAIRMYNESIHLADEASDARNSRPAGIDCQRRRPTRRLAGRTARSNGPARGAAVSVHTDPRLVLEVCRYACVVDPSQRTPEVRGSILESSKRRIFHNSKEYRQWKCLSFWAWSSCGSLCRCGFCRASASRRERATLVGRVRPPRRR